ncbi:hypothetical protein B932_1465 [Gluconobacter oxydans H24]|nr:hypothetical protein B932_1465 [Gluconobacter oxydans H24]
MVISEGLSRDFHNPFFLSAVSMPGRENLAFENRASVSLS